MKNKPLKRFFHPAIYVLSLSCVLIGGFFLSTEKLVVDRGEAGVLWKRFSGETERYSDGSYRISRFNRLYVYDVGLQQRKTSFNAIDLDGRRIEVSAVIEFTLVEHKLDQLHADIGPNYADLFLLPEVTSVIRQWIGFNRVGVLGAETRLASEKLNLSVLEDSMRGWIKIQKISEVSVALSSKAVD
ncbi:MAG: hypothetical protein ACRBBW_02235 [Cellvibrionaceae bacterium]